MTAGLNQTVRELQQLLQAVSRQLAKGQEGVRLVSMLFSPTNKTWCQSPVVPLAVHSVEPERLWCLPGG